VFRAAAPGIDFGPSQCHKQNQNEAAYSKASGTHASNGDVFFELFIDNLLIKGQEDFP
jgi:hypothetical protein